MSLEDQTYQSSPELSPADYLADDYLYSASPTSSSTSPCHSPGFKDSGQRGLNRGPNMNTYSSNLTVPIQQHSHILRKIFSINTFILIPSSSVTAKLKRFSISIDLSSYSANSSL